MLVFLSFIFVAYQMVVRIFFGIMLEDIIILSNASMGSVGLAAGIYYLSFALSSIGTSLLFVRYNFILIMLLGLSMLLFGLLCFLNTAFGFNGIILGRALIGIGSGMSLPLYLQVFKIFYDAKYIKTMVNYIFLNCMITLSLSLGCVKPYYNILYTYYDLIYAFLVLGVLLFVLFVKVYIDSCKKESVISQLYIKKDSISLEDLKNFAFDKKVLFLGLVSGLLAASPDAFSDLWSLMFLEKCCNINAPEYIMIYFWMFYAVAGFILQYIFNYLRITIIWFMIFISIIITFIYLSFFTLAYFDSILFKPELTYYILIFLVIVLAICCGYKPFLFGNVVNFLNSKFSILGIVIINSFCMFYGQLFHSFIGLTLQLLQNYYSIKTSYIIALSIIPLCSLISLVLFLLNQNIFCNK